jgi:hypothetical protein
LGLLRLFILFLILIIASPAWATEATSTIAASGDIAHPTSGDAGAGSDDIYFPYSADTRRTFMRFKIAIPDGATIDSAYVHFYSYSDYSNASTMNVKATAEDNALSFTTNAYERSVGSASVSWNSGASSWTTGTEYQTDDLKTLIQEWVDRTEYIPDAYVGLRFQYNSGGARELYGWGDNTKLAHLVVNYTGGNPDMRVYMPELESRSKVNVRGDFMFLRTTDKWKVSLNDSQVYLKSGNLSTTEYYTVDLTSLTAGTHHIDVQLLDTDNTVISTVTKTWTTLHNGAPTVGFDENGSIVLSGSTKYFPIMSFLTYPAHDYNTLDGDPIVNGVQDMGSDNSNPNFGPTQFTTWLTNQNNASMKGGGPGFYSFVYPWFSAAWPRYHALNVRVNETFEGPGYIEDVCGGETTESCWTEVSGTITDNDTTDSLVGTYSAKLDGTSTEAVLRYTLNDPTAIVAFKFAVKDKGESRVATDLIRFRNGATESANDLVGKLRWNADGTMSAHHCVLANDTAECSTDNNNKLTGSTVFSVGTTYYVWVLWDSTQSTYNQGTMKVWVSESAADPTAGTPEINIVYSGTNGGSGLGAIVNVDLVANGTTLLYDNFNYWGTDMRAFVEAASTNAGLLYYSFDDEPDLGCTSSSDVKCANPARLKVWNDLIHAYDTNHPHIELFTGGILWSTDSTSNAYAKKMFCGTAENLALFSERRNVIDAVIFDSYPYEYYRKPGWSLDIEETLYNIDVIHQWSKGTMPVLIALETVDLHDNYNGGTFNAETYLSIASWDSGTWAAGDTVTGQSSGATATVPTPTGSVTLANFVRTSNNILLVDKGNATAFTAGEQIVGTGGATATLANPAKLTTRPFGTTNDITYDWTRPPTAAELKNLIWLSVIHGAKGLVHFQYFGDKTILKETTLAFYNDMETHKDVVLSAVSSKCTVETDTMYCAASVAGTGRVDYMVRESGSTTWVFAARVPLSDEGWPETDGGTETATFTISGLANGTTITRYGEGTTLSSGNGSFQDTFTDYQVHIYQLGEESGGGGETGSGPVWTLGTGAVATFQ